MFKISYNKIYFLKLQLKEKYCDNISNLKSDNKLNVNLQGIIQWLFHDLEYVLKHHIL